MAAKVWRNFFYRVLEISHQQILCETT